MKKTPGSRHYLISIQLFVLFLLATCGCASNAYQYGRLNSPTPIQSMLQSTNVTKIGGNYPKLDKLENVVQAVPRFFEEKAERLRRLRNSDESQPAIDPEIQQGHSIQLAQEYLAANGIEDVNLEVRRYEPAQQWQRLKANKEIAPVFKYTHGLANLAAYTLLPNRVFHTNKYDPYTRTLSLNSFEPEETLLDVADIKQHNKHQFKGAYAALQNAPIVPLVHQALVSSDALSYAKTHQPQLENKMYPIVYSNMASSSVSEVLGLALPAGTPIHVKPIASTVAGAVGGFMGDAIAPERGEGR